MDLTAVESFVNNPERPLPQTSAEAAPFWASLLAGRFSLQACAECRKLRQPPRVACPACGSREFVWTEIHPRGTLYSYTTVFRAPSDAFRPFVPYMIALVDVADGQARLIGNLLGADPDRVSIGDEVRLVIDRRDQTQALYHFELASAAATELG